MFFFLRDGNRQKSSQSIAMGEPAHLIRKMNPPTGLLDLPTEIRLQIYHLLLTDHGHPSLSIRTEHASLYDLRRPESRTRTRYRHMADRFRARTIESTYHLLQNPGIDPSILRVNRQLHTEAAHVLYSHHTFCFGADVESVAPFLSDLTPCARSSIKRIALLKRALPYTKDFDRCEWRSACASIAAHLRLSHLDLWIQGGKPRGDADAAGPDHRSVGYSKADFDLVTRADEMEWARQVAWIRGLEGLTVKACLEHCPPRGDSLAMKFFVDFSRSIEAGFAEWLRACMVAVAV